jgi:ethanolamine transporter EutH
MMKEMDERGKVVNAAFLVCGASALAAHMGFTFGVESELVVPLLICKILGGLAGAAPLLHPISTLTVPAHIVPVRRSRSRGAFIYQTGIRFSFL